MIQQTAVEWVAEKMEKLIPPGNQIAISIMLDQAKQMEKEQMLWFFRKFHMITEESNNHYIKEFEHYYNETFSK